MQITSIFLGFDDYYITVFQKKSGDKMLVRRLNVNSLKY